MKTTAVLLFLSVFGLTFASEFDSKEAAELINTAKRYKIPVAGHFEGIIVESRKGPSKFQVEKGNSQTIFREVEVNFDKSNFRYDWTNYEVTNDGKPVEFRQNNKLTAIQTKDRNIEYRDYGNRSQRGYVLPNNGGVGRSLMYPYSYDAMLQSAGKFNCGNVEKAYKNHYVIDTEDGPMDVITLASPEFKSFVTEIGIYQNNKRLGLYKKYKNGALIQERSFSGYTLTDSGKLYPTKMTYKKIESTLPDEIIKKIETKKLKPWSKEVLSASTINWEHSYDWEIEKAELLEEIPSSVFSYTFPPGTIVVDSTGPEDIEYTVPNSKIDLESLDVPNIKDNQTKELSKTQNSNESNNTAYLQKTIADDAAEAASLKPTEDIASITPSSKRNPVFLIAFCAGVVILLLILYVFLKKKSGRI